MTGKKHFICTHTWNSADAREEALKTMENMTDREFFDALRTDKAETLQHWMGKDDFFFCHWYAESEEDIYESLDKTGFSSLMITLPSEMPRFVTQYEINDSVMKSPNNSDI